MKVRQEQINIYKEIRKENERERGTNKNHTNNHNNYHNHFMKTNINDNRKHQYTPAGTVAVT